MRESSSRAPGLAGWPETRLLGLLLLLAVVPYANTLLNAFVYDDLKQVLANPYVQSWRHLPDIFGSNVWSFLGAAGVTNHYRPLMTLTYLVCYQVFGPLPFGFHLVNLLFHAGVVWMLYRVTERLFANRLAAFVAAALFALHPIHTESVAWVAGITDLQLAFFYLLTFSFFLQLGDTEDAQGGSRLRTHLAMAASFLLALLSKEIAATLPLVAIVYEHGCRADRCQTTFAQKVRRYGSLWALIAAYIVFRIGLLGAIAPLPRRELPGWPEAILSGFALAAQYVWKLLWPVELSAFYVFHKSQSLGDPRVLAGIAVIGAVGMLFFFLWRRNRAAAFSLFWIFATLGPVLNARWMAANVFAERYLYLPSAGFCWLLAWAWTKQWSNARGPALRRILAGGLGLVALLYAARVVTRNRDWRDDETLYTRTLAVAPDAYLIRNNLGTVYWNRGDQAAAVREWRRALEQQPEDVVLLNNLGLAAARQKRFAEAEGFFHRAMQIRPGYPEPYFNLGRAYEQMGRVQDAEREYRRALAQAPLHTATRNALGELLLRAGRADGAVEQFSASLASQPNPEGFTGLGEALLTSDPSAAQKAFLQALTLNPYEVRARLGLARLYAAANRPAEALREYEAAQQLDPHNAEAKDAVSRLRSARPGNK